jgi:hypothetical protein
MLSFHKDRDCPSSQELLEFQNGGTQNKKDLKINEHICTCDFCGAEADFYAHFPQSMDDRIKATQIPDHLFQLAEALLNNKDKGNKLLKKLLQENERFAI